MGLQSHFGSLSLAYGMRQTPKKLLYKLFLLLKIDRFFFFSEGATNELRYGKIWILVTQPFLPLKESAHCVSTSFHYAKLLIKTGSRMSHNNGWWRRLLHIKESCKEVITKTIAELSPWASNHFSHETWNSSDDLTCRKAAGTTKNTKDSTNAISHEFSSLMQRLVTEPIFQSVFSVTLKNLT